MQKDTSFSHDGTYHILHYYYRDELYWPDFYGLWYQFDDHQQIFDAMAGINEIQAKIARELLNPEFDPLKTVE